MVAAEEEPPPPANRAKPAATPTPIQTLVEVDIPVDSAGGCSVAAGLLAVVGVVLAGTPGLVGCFVGGGGVSKPIAAAR